MILAGDDLISLTDRLVVSELEHFVVGARNLYPDTSVDLCRITDGCAALFGADSVPFSEVVGIGSSSSERPDADIERIEEFYAGTGAIAECLVPCAGSARVAATLARRGWVPSAFENVLVRDATVPVRADAEPGEWDIRRADPQDFDRWADCVAKGFSSTGRVSTVEERFARVVARREGSSLLWAWVDGEPVATGEIHVSGRTAWLSADTTREGYRGRGIQHALQRERIQMAIDAGCELVGTEAVPYGPSHRNAQRNGFAVAFTRSIMKKDFGLEALN